MSGADTHTAAQLPGHKDLRVVARCQHLSPALLAEAVNKFFEVTVRIQTERGQRVIDTGPYAIVRHPGYVGGVLFCVGTALCLGSLWALIPAGLASALLILRTQWEDQTLQAELGDLVVEARLPHRGQPSSGTYEGEGYVIVRHEETAVVEAALRRVVDVARVVLAESP